MRRIAEAPVKLSDGTVIPKGAFTWVTLDAYRNPDIYANPGEFNPRRFLDLRNQLGQENKWQLVSTTGNHLGKLVLRIPPPQKRPVANAAARG